MKIQRSITSLEGIIQSLINDLEKYAQRENANQLYIDKQNVLIKNLVGIHNTINSIRFLEVWQNIEAEMQRLEKLDNQLKGHNYPKVIC